MTYLSGRVLNSSGNPIKDALWKSGTPTTRATTSIRRIPLATRLRREFPGLRPVPDQFQRQYLFRTVKAGLYQGRTRHYHVAVTVPGQTTRYTTQTFWNETTYDESGKVWSIQNSNDMVYTGINNTAQQAAVNLTYTAVDGVTNAVGATFDFVVGLTPVEPAYPASGGFVTAGAMVAGPTSTPRFK